MAQTRTRLAGQLPDSATRLVSLHDPDARPIRKGRIDRPVEFGFKAQVADNDNGVADSDRAAPRVRPMPGRGTLPVPGRPEVSLGRRLTELLAAV